MQTTLQRVVLAAIAASILAGIVPAGIALDRRLAAVLIERARDDLTLAPRLLADRHAATADAMMMHAKELTHVEGLAAAVARGDRSALMTIVEQSRSSYPAGEPVVAGGSPELTVGPAPPKAMVDETREGKMPVALTSDGQNIRNVALAPIFLGTRWMGAAGFANALDERAAGALSGLTRADVVLVPVGAGSPSASTLDSARVLPVYEVIRTLPVDGVPREVGTGALRFIGVAAPLGEAGTAYFVRTLDQELAVLPALRRMAILSAIGALAIALLLGALFAARVARPVGTLARAASAIGRGEFQSPLPTSRVEEVSLLSKAFADMRRALAARLEELRETNVMLADRSSRLTALQADLVQRERLEATGHLVAQLAHEIRNPVANLRNCLEVIRRRVEGDAQAREFADLAIDELLRMHELAERMLDLNRPREGGARSCRPYLIARDIARLSAAATMSGGPEVQVTGDASVCADIAPDALKQVLHNLVRNAGEAIAGQRGDGRREAMVTIEVAASGTQVMVRVRDNGPGVPEGVKTRIFDPFFSTKENVHGVGLGLFVAEGLVRSAGGKLSVVDAADGWPGAVFEVSLPLATDSADESTPGPATLAPLAVSYRAS